jgi:hypothetical protein
MRNIGMGIDLAQRLFDFLGHALCHSHAPARQRSVDGQAGENRNLYEVQRQAIDQCRQEQNADENSGIDREIIWADPLGSCSRRTGGTVKPDRSRNGLGGRLLSCF